HQYLEGRECCCKVIVAKTIDERGVNSDGFARGGVRMNCWSRTIFRQFQRRELPAELPFPVKPKVFEVSFAQVLLPCCILRILNRNLGQRWCASVNARVIDLCQLSSDQ